MKAFIRNNKWFFVPYFLLLVVCLAHLFRGEKGDLNILLNDNHSRFWDHFFVQYTNFGDGVTAVIFCLCLALISKRWFFGLSSAMITVAVVSQLLKHAVNGPNPRPRQFFMGNYQFRDILWLDPHDWNSMPSGHTATAFCIFAFMAFISRKKIYGYVSFTAAAMVAFSRVYLAQHFLDDVVAGSILGTLIAVLFYQVFLQIKKYPSFDQPLIRDRFEK